VRDRLKSARLVGTAALGFVLLTYPMLSLADEGGRVLGIPSLYAYLFVVWVLLIALIALAVRVSR
jgi:hypothetical protein